MFEVVRDALAADSTLSHIKVSVGARFQGEQNPEVIIQQSSFDINDLNTADYGAFEISVFCYANTYTEAAKIADTVFTAIQENDLYTLTEQELIVGSDPEQYNISQTLYHLKGLDLFLEHYDEDGYEANVLVRAIEAEDTTTGVGNYIPKTSGSPAPFYAQLDSRIQDLSDVNVNSLGEGQILKYDVSEGEWVNADLPLFANNGLVSSNVNGITLLSLADSQTFTTASTSGDLTVGGNLNFTGPQTKLIRPFDLGQAAGPLTIQSNGDLVIELDENADELDKAFIVKNGANSEVFKVDEAGNVTVNQEYILPTTDGGTDYFLKTDGDGQLYFATLYGTSGNTGGAPPPAIDTISELFDTQISALADNQILRYDSGSSKWVNEDLTLAQSIGDLTDVDTTTTAPADGQALVWNNTNSEWEPGDVGIEGFETELSPDSIKSWYASFEQVIDTATSAGVYPDAIALTANEGHPRDVCLSPDGLSIYIVGNGTDRIWQYTLNTAFDLTSLDLSSEKSVYIGSSDGTPVNLYIADDPNDTSTYGKKFFVIGDSTNKVFEFLATTAWDVTTIDDAGDGGTAASNATFSLPTTPDHAYSGVCFSRSGSKMFVTRNSNNSPEVQVYDLSTNYDITTSVVNSTESIDFSNVRYRPNWYTNNLTGTHQKVNALEFNSDGTKLYLVTDYNLIQELDLSTPYDVTTYTHVDTQDFTTYRTGMALSSTEGDTTLNTLSGIFYSKDADYVFIVFNDRDEIIRLNRDNLVISGANLYQDDVVVRNSLYARASEIELLRVTGGCRLPGNIYIGGAMNWSGFNSGPGVTKNNTFFLGTGMGSLAFVNSNQPSSYPNATSKDVNNTTAGTWIFPSDLTGANNIVLPALSGNVILDTTPNLYYNRFDSDAESKITGATEDIEYYYTARTDGQGSFQRQIGALPASGQALTRTSYYSDKAFADPDTAADWTQGTAYTSTSLADSISQSTDTLLNAQSTGTPPLSTKIVVSNYLGSSGLVSGDANGFGGTSVAYSLRLLNHAYAGAAIRVVNDSNVEADIGFDSNYELDTTALLAHCGSGDGYLVKWYDQAKGGSTGDGNDATWESNTSYSSRKPQIVSAGSVITDNGKPCLETIDAGMVMDEQFSASNEYDLFFVAQKTLNNNNHGMIWGTQTGNDCRVWLNDYRLNLEVNNGENWSQAFGDGGANTYWYQMGQFVFNVRRDASDVNTAQRNDVVGNTNYTRGGAMKTDRILNAWNNQGYSFAGNVQEIIMLDGDKSSERSAILSNLNTYYSVY